MALRPGDALAEIMLLHRQHDVAVLGVNERHGAEFGAAHEGREHLLVVDHQRALVGHEMLEGRHPVGDHLGHLLAHRVRPIGDAHVIGVVGRGAFGALVPVLQRLHQRLVAAGNAEVGDHRRAAGERRPGAALVIVGRIGSHEGHVEMGVGIDAARHDVAAGGVDRAVASEAIADRLDPLTLDQHVRLVAAVRRDDGSTSDDERHVRSPSSVVDAAFISRQEGLSTRSIPLVSFPRERESRLYGEAATLDSRFRENDMSRNDGDAAAFLALNPRSPPSRARRASARWRRRSTIPA